MTLQLEVGKYYKNRKGEKIGPIINNRGTASVYIFTIEDAKRDVESWQFNGKVWANNTSDYDLIEEWKDEDNGPDTRTMEYGIPFVVTANKQDTNDPVNNPSHYTSHPSSIECIEITRHMNFNLGNALKYIWRADLKDDAIQDLKKAIFYIQDEIDKREKQG